jgi:HD-GYP domain-containing protein (c-di-GMP phosphodiesterase class II)
MLPDLLPIHPWTLLPDRIVGVDVLVWDEQAMTAIKCIDSQEQVTRSSFDQIARGSGQKCYIENRNQGQYRRYLSESLESSEQQSTVPPLLRFTLLFESVRFQLLDGLGTCSLSKWVQSSYDATQHFLEKSSGMERLGKEIVSTFRKDGGFATHAFNTGVYAYLIAKEMGLSTLDQRECLTSGFLHDTGKLELDPDYPDQIEVPDGYMVVDSRQEQIVHCTVGFVFLSKIPSITRTPLLACYQHHEYVNGMGFPVGLEGPDIPLTSKVCALANRWDGLLCDRKGRPGLSRIAAWKQLSSESGTLWDKELVSCLERLLNRPSRNY